MAVKRVFRYLIHTLTFGLWYSKGSRFKLVGYSDSDWAGDKVDRKSTSGACQFLGRSFVSWSSKKQNYVSLPTAKAEYVEAASCCAQLLWMRQPWRIMEFIVRRLHSCVTMRVPSRLLIIRFNTTRRSTLRSNITSFRTMSIEVILTYLM
jgi:hypothetical protein